MYTGNGIWVLPEVKMECPLGRRRQCTVEHLDCIAVLCDLAVYIKLNIALVCTGLGILWHLHREPETTYGATVNYGRVGAGNSVSNKILAIGIDIVLATTRETVCNYRLYETAHHVRGRDNALAVL